MSNTAITLLVDIISKDAIPILCMKLAVACLCNMSLMSEFQDQITSLAVHCLVNKVIGAPQVHMGVKMDAVQSLYNLVTLFPQSRRLVIESDGVMALWKVTDI